ncbi:MAG: hypothetical protein KDA96_07400 [Planctomycetaceae bacterium]|nr:hypothetical protein [Planctomycetaceae bacterium]
MGSKLLVRCYNVGCGDCVYVRIPDGKDHFHILIDCGSKEGASSGVMERAIRHLADHELPTVDGTKKKRLDLLVATHRHEDHIKGFDPKVFQDIAIGNIWLSAAMDLSHPQAQQTHALHAFASESVRAMQESGTAFSPELSDMVGLYGISNQGAITALTDSLPRQNGITPKFVFAGQTSNDLGVSIEKTRITVLGPEKDIDGYYLGKQADKRLRGMQAGAAHFQSAVPARNKPPANISNSDFRRLQSRLLSNGLAFAVDDTSIQNNVSTVLLIEWRKRRLLFVGDAEWEEEFADGRKNGSWNVMWQKRKKYLSKPLDFLKVGHHGSHNATPWFREAGPEHEVNQIFNAILPLPDSGTKPKAKCLVSTKRKQYDTIPDGELLTELGKRVSNTRNYLKDFQAADPGFDPEKDIFNYSVMKRYSSEPKQREVGDKGWLDRPQPIRTDLESAGRGQGTMPGDVEFIEVEIDP